MLHALLVPVDRTPDRPASRRAVAGWRAWLAALVLLVAAAVAAPGARAGTALPGVSASDVAALAREALGLPASRRVEVTLEEPDARLRPAPCPRVEAFRLPGLPMQGRTRIGLRCPPGATPWQAFLPVTVRLPVDAPVLAVALPAGATIEPGHLRMAEIDAAAVLPSGPVADAALAVGRRLAVALPAGAPLRAEQLRGRLWFAAGEPVTVTRQGEGFRVATEGQALGQGVDGQPVRVRTAAGRIVTGVAVGNRQVEIPS